MIALIIGVVILLCGVASIRLHRSSLSEFEVRRRLEEKHANSLLEWRRHDLLRELSALKAVMTALLLVSATVLLIVRFEWWGAVAAFVLTLFYHRLASLGPLHALVQSRYDAHEPAILQWADRHRAWLRPLCGLTESTPTAEVASRDELLHIIDEVSADTITSEERKMLRGALGFTGKRVKEYMTPRSAMEVIGVNELLGPLVLDDLHKTGHSHFPVLDGDIDHIVGMLHLHNLLSLVDKRSVTVGDVMEPKVLFIHENQTLEEALSVCIKYRRHLLVVVNELRETVGVITIEDAVVQLIGRAIVDKNDNHEDLQAVAARRPHGNKLAQGSDVSATVVE